MSRPVRAIPSFDTHQQPAHTSNQCLMPLQEMPEGSSFGPSHQQTRIGSQQCEVLLERASFLLPREVQGLECSSLETGPGSSANRRSDLSAQPDRLKPERLSNARVQLTIQYQIAIRQINPHPLRKLKQGVPSLDIDDHGTPVVTV